MIRCSVGRRTGSLIGVFVVFAAAVFFSLSYAPPAKINRDSGVFLYGGWQVLQGKLPYVDFWDHKPPAVFVYNAIGLSLGAGEWGVWLFETLLFASSLTFFSIAVKQRFGALASTIAVFVLLFSTRNNDFFENGNLTEGYAVCFSLFILAGLLLQSQHVLVWLLMGMAGATIGFTKQSCIALPAAVGVALGWEALAGGSDKVKRYCIAYVSGGLSVLTIGLLVMRVLGILPAFWDTNFVFSRLYIAAHSSDVGLLRRIYRALCAFDSMGVLNVSLFIFIATSLRCLFNHATTKRSTRLLLLEPTILLALPLEFFFVSLPSRFYPHYFLGLFPLIAVGLAIWYDTVCRFVPWLMASETATYRRALLVSFVICLPFLMFSGPLSIVKYPNTLRLALSRKASYNSGVEDRELMRYLTTKYADCPLLMWGAETKWNFVTRRPSPSRFCYFFPLLYPNYGQEAKFRELLGDLAAHPDTVIVDTCAGAGNGLEKIEPTLRVEEKEAVLNEGHYVERREQLNASALQGLRNYVSTEYRVDMVFRNKWVAYVPRRMDND